MVGINGVWNVNYYNGSSRFLGVLLNGYSISTIASFNSGAPFTITTGSDNNKDGYNNDRPNLVPGVNPFLSLTEPASRLRRRGSTRLLSSRTANRPQQALRPARLRRGLALAAPTATRRATTCVRRVTGTSILGSPATFKFERGIGLTFRADATNAFNMVSLNAPGSSGVAPTLGAAPSSGTLGKITGAASPRLIQVGARISF